MTRNLCRAFVAALAGWSLLAFSASSAFAGESIDTLLNVSYDPTRAFYQSYDALFAAHWRKFTGHGLVVRESYGASGAQARAVISGLKADVVTLGAGSDIDAIADRSHLLASNWEGRLPDASSPYTSTIVLLVRKGNPRGIRDWADLLRPNLVVVTPNPDTSAGARWMFLAAYAYALRHAQGSDGRAQDFMKSLYRHVATLDNGARAATSTFVERGVGDALMIWENEAYAILRSPQGVDYQLVVPSISIVAQPPVAWIDANVIEHRDARLARAYLHYLYSPSAQRLACDLGYRPVDRTALRECATHFSHLDLVDIRAFGGWAVAQRRFFSEGGIFDRVFSSI